jgi:hypothetical protein
VAEDGDRLAEVADALYALEPEDFTSARAAAAKADPALKKQVGELRKPTVSAWVVNVLAREDPDLLGSLLELGPALAEAQRSGAGADLRQLSEQRRQLLGAVVQRAVDLAGREVSATVRGEVEATLDAGLVDPQVATVVRSGQLVRPLSFAGFGGVDLDGAVAVRAAAPSRPSGSARAEEERAARTAAAEQRALEAAGELDDAVRAHDVAAEEHARAVAAAEQAREAVTAAEQALVDAKEAEVSSRHEAQGTDTALARAARAVARAQTTAERTRADLDALRRG